MHTPTPQVLQACTAAGIDPDALINWRTSPAGIVLINRLGQKFAVPIQTAPQTSEVSKAPCREDPRKTSEVSSKTTAKPSKRPAAPRRE